MTNPISITQSFTGYAERETSEYLMVTKEDHFGSRFTKLTFGMLSFGLLGCIGVIETIVRYVFVALLFFGQKFLPESLSKWYQTKIYTPVKESADLTAQATKESFKKTVTNFSPAQ